MASSISKANQEDAISYIQISDLLNDDETVIQGYIELLRKYFKVELSTSTSPFQVRDALINFEKHVLIPDVKRLSLRSGNYEKILGVLCISRAVLLFPSLGLVSAPGFKALWERKHTNSLPSKNSVARASLNQHIYDKVVFTKLEDIYFENRFRLILHEIRKKLGTLDDDVIDDLILKFGNETYINLEEAALVTFNEGETAKWILAKLLNPIIVFLYNNLLNEDGCELRAAVQKIEYLKMEKLKNLPSGDFRLCEETFQTYPDITIVFKPADSNLLYNIMNVELKRFNSIKVFSRIGMADFKWYFLQILSQIISGNFLISCLTDGYSFILMKINFNNQLEEFLTHPDKPGTKIPMSFKLVDITKSGVTAKASILGMLDDEVRNFSKLDYKRKISKIQRLKEICLKSNVDFVHTLLNWVNHHFSESKNYPSYEIDYAPDIYDGNHISLFQNGPGKGPQILLVSKALCKRLLNVKSIKTNDEEPVVISIYDPTRYQIQNYTEGDAIGLKEAQNLFMDMYKNQVKAYDIIKRFNQLNGSKINVLTHFKTGNIKLKIKDFSYYAGKFIIHEHVTSRPSTKQHYEQAIEQVNLLNLAGIQLNDIAESDIVLSKGKIYLTNFDNSTFGNENEGDSGCLSILESLLDDVSKSKKPKHE
ncbi:hypothetical protein BN7_4862 [Wickerhamomyces ciferrii]|uniref:Uncharacterized protein n=1 Tax=Wickerhamomyces ciferrii (strain ATCC 14091 / BCRC 22168 / CBS 111 / JCM 3599 / NBRC 0793 / NRRL Y-1031 F-60-10) TaxID=1206466 RepID=K0KJ90_WICCF|nr:uncharacterized protein BN7_4862 [Wickerhamomyces ciferrii]CCH45280.1 hypothetical protein BN7_4862 [Wickerhamomyces ciferrii]